MRVSTKTVTVQQPAAPVAQTQREPIAPGANSASEDTQAQDPAPAPAPAPKPKAKPVHHAEPKPKVPNVVGMRLDVAEDTLDRAGVTYHEIGGGTFGIIARDNWGVCSTNGHGDIGLVAGHFKCGAE